MVHDITVCGSYGTNIIGTLHAAFNLEAVNACGHQIRHFVYELQIARREVVALLNAAIHLCSIETAARLRTHAAVCGLPAQVAGKKAQSALAYAESSMHEHFKLCGRIRLDC